MIKVQQIKLIISVLAICHFYFSDMSEHLKNTEKFKTVSVSLLHFWFGPKISR